MNVTHLAWDVMVGLGTLLFLLTLWWWASWIFRRDMPRSRWFLRASATTGVLAVITLEAGWTVSEVGRQPWIVYEKMKVEDAATANTGIWVTFIGVVLLYIGLGVTTVLVLRGMSRRFRSGDRFDEADVPYGPSERPDELEGAPAHEHRGRRHPLRGRHHVRRSSAAPTSVPASGTWSPAGRSVANDPARSSTTRSPPSGRRTTSG